MVPFPDPVLQEEKLDDLVCRSFSLNVVLRRFEGSDGDGNAHDLSLFLLAVLPLM